MAIRDAFSQNEVVTLLGPNYSYENAQNLPEMFWAFVLRCATAGQDKAGRSDFPHFAAQAAPGKNTENIQIFFLS